jgi:DNA modification methylase
VRIRDVLESCAMKMQTIATEVLKRNPRNARTHSAKQIRQIADSIREFGFVVPIVVDEDNIIVAGHGRLDAAKLLGFNHVPVIEVHGLSEAKRRALALADNRIGGSAGWNRELLAIEFTELSGLLLEEGLDISITGFSTVEIDQISADFEKDTSDPADAVDPKWLSPEAVSKVGDLWILGRHSILCGDARQSDTIQQLMGDGRATMAFMDPPYNVRVRNIVGRGRNTHREFAMASGEMSSSDFVEFLTSTLNKAALFSRDGALHYVCIDWRHVGELLKAGLGVYGETLNLAVWVKTNAGQGSFYRSQHELIAVFRVGDAPHLNNVELGRHGRNRSNVWHYPGANTFRKGRLDDLKSHPTVKPVALVADAMKDCTRRDDIVLDTFCGSGTTILAAERVGRRARALEIDPRYVDVSIRRWQAFTARDAVHAKTGLNFDQTAADAGKQS